MQKKLKIMQKQAKMPKIAQKIQFYFKTACKTKNL